MHAFRLLTGMSLVVLSAVSHAQWKPSKPINIIVPWAAGGATDQVTRVAAGELEEALGTKIVVINQPGAAGSIGTMNALNAPRDGYTWTAGAPKQLGTYPVLGLPRATFGSEFLYDGISLIPMIIGRSEERRVGKECRSRWSPYH